MVKPSPIFEFYVYSIYRKRGDDQRRCKVFRVFSTGYHLALESINSHDEQQDIDNDKSQNKLDLFFKCVKRKGIESKPDSYRGIIEFVDDICLTAEQVEFFRQNRVMMK